MGPNVGRQTKAPGDTVTLPSVHQLEHSDINRYCTAFPKPLQRAALVALHKTAITLHISRRVRLPP